MTLPSLQPIEPDSEKAPASKRRTPMEPGRSLHKLKDELARRGVVVSHNAVWTFLRREGLSFKKNTVRS